jgi:hypothetical protein
MSTHHHERSDVFDFRKSVAYDDARKREFHRLARHQLGLLAKALDLPPGSFDLRSNMAGIAVSGEITLHGEHIYVQASQPFCGFDTGILIRTCKGRKDYVGGPNNFASLDLLREPERLSRMVRQVFQGGRP